MHRKFTAVLLLAALAAAVVYAAEHARTEPLRSQPLAGIPNKVADMLTVEYAPGGSTPAHRHNANVLVYVLEGALLMGVNGKEPVKVSAGQTYYESPNDEHTVSRNASATEKAKFLVVLIHDQGVSTMQPASEKK
ncbi:MAG TPA: cupin domain-containing protein [Steroidobacteraceae bacterium]|nr:cupin domain-containing protein [Steroidobacteraceae bacterium]